MNELSGPTLLFEILFQNEHDRLDDSRVCRLAVDEFIVRHAGL
jgi:hypothetical protein